MKQLTINRKKILHFLELFKNTKDNICFYNFDYEELEESYYEAIISKDVILFWNSNSADSHINYISYELPPIINRIKELPLNNLSILLENIPLDSIDNLKNTTFNYRIYNRFQHKRLSYFSKDEFKNNQFCYAKKHDFRTLYNILNQNFPHPYEIFNKRWITKRLDQKEILISKYKGEIIAFCIFKIVKNTYEGYYLFSKSQKINPISLVLSSLWEGANRGATSGFSYIEESNSLSKGLHKLLQFKKEKTSLVALWN